MMTPEEEMELVLHAIRETTSGYLIWDEEKAQRVHRELGSEGLAPEAIRVILQKFVRGGGEIETRDEQRPQWMQHRDRWYLAIIPMKMFVNGLFVEFWLSNRDRKAPIVEIVNAHSQR